MVLKSTYGAYLTVNPNQLECHTALEMHDERSVWFIQIANAVQLP